MDAFTLHNLEIFACIIKHRSLSRAAEELFLSPSTVSIHLKNLENYLGTELLEHHGRTIKPTAAGVILYEAAHESLANLREAKNQIIAINRGSTGRLNVGIASTMGTYILPEIIKRFRKRYPGIELFVQLSGISRCAENILNSLTELAIAAVTRRNDRLTYIPFFSDEIVFVTSTQNSSPGILEKDILGPGDLEHLTLITRKSGSSTHEMIISELRKGGITFREIVSRNNLEQIKEDILNSQHIAAISRYIAQEEIGKGLLRIVNIANLKLTRPVCFIHRTDQTLSSPAITFIQLCKTSLPEYLAS